MRGSGIERYVVAASAAAVAAVSAIALGACAGQDELQRHPEALLGSPPSASCPGPRPIQIVAADVAIVIDRSASTRQPTGLDVDGDGTVGRFALSEYTDRDDSLLAVQLAAVEALVSVARLGDMRFAIVSYSGRDDFPLEDTATQHVSREDARVETPLTDDSAALEAALDRVARRGSDGTTSFAPAMKLALRTLRAEPGGEPDRRRRVLFLADAPTLLRYAPMRRIARDDMRVELEIARAIEAGVSFDSFGVGDPVTSEDDVHALALIAGATGGDYHPVPDPRNLYCQMVAALGVRERR